MAWKYLCFQKHPEASKKTTAWQRGYPGLWGAGEEEETSILLSPGTLDQQTPKVIPSEVPNPNR